jgi:hypothetical protein
MTHPIQLDFKKLQLMFILVGLGRICVVHAKSTTAIMH